MVTSSFVVYVFVVFLREKKEKKCFFDFYIIAGQRYYISDESFMGLHKSQGVTFSQVEQMKQSRRGLNAKK